MHTTYKISAQSQKGIALFVVIIFVLISTLLALWASRSSIFNELILSNESDYQRAFEAAQTLIQDAELDIRNELSNGSVCQPSTQHPEICRAGANALRFPAEEQEVSSLFITLANQPTFCQAGICLRIQGPEDFWNNSNPDNGLFCFFHKVHIRWNLHNPHHELFNLMSPPTSLSQLMTQAAWPIDLMQKPHQEPPVTLSLKMEAGALRPKESMY